MEALCREMEWASPRFRNRELASIFIGGGTPSLFSPESIGTILRQAKRSFAWAPDTEITLEANPGTAEAERFKGYRAVGVTRLSIGVQSFDNERLLALGRIHTAEQARAAYQMGREAHFSSINIDLMYGLPGQTPQGAKMDLIQAMELAPEHFSYYQLTLEEGTPFFYHPPARPDETALACMDEEAWSLLAQAGYQRYEVSAYAKSMRYTCRHNLGYWRYGDYLGIGAGAHSKFRDANGIWRQARTRSPAHYMEAIESGQGAYEEKRLEPVDVRFEFFLNALRLSGGFPPELYHQQTGEDLATVAETLDELTDLGLLEVTPQRICPTQRGYALLDDVVAHFLPSR